MYACHDNKDRLMVNVSHKSEKRVATIPSKKTVPGISFCEPVEHMSSKVKFGIQVVMDQ